MALFEILQYVIIGLYLVGTGAFLAGSLVSRNSLIRVGNIFAVLGFIMHTVDLTVAVTLYHETVLDGGYFYYSILGWGLILVYFFFWWKFRNTFFALTASPLALLLFISSLAAQSLKVTLPKHLAGLFIGLHIGTIFVSIALMAMAAGAGAAFIYLNNKIKSKAAISGFGKDMPSLNSFDRINHWAIVVGFPLYTLGLAAGFLWARSVYKQMFSWDPKEIVTLIVWFLFAFLFHQRIALGWKGKKPAMLVIIVFVITMVSLWGINFFMNTHHSFKP
jgi:ABC-type transport system involved in cytochrome c biogenesis permease subunit